MIADHISLPSKATTPITEAVTPKTVIDAIAEAYFLLTSTTTIASDILHPVCKKLEDLHERLLNYNLNGNRWP